VDIFTPLPSDSVGKAIMFLGCPVVGLLFVRSDIVTTIYLINGLNNFDLKKRQRVSNSPYWWPG